MWSIYLSLRIQYTMILSYLRLTIQRLPILQTQIGWVYKELGNGKLHQPHWFISPHPSVSGYLSAVFSLVKVKHTIILVISEPIREFWVSESKRKTKNYYECNVVATTSSIAKTLLKTRFRGATFCPMFLQLQSNSAVYELDYYWN